MRILHTMLRVGDMQKSIDFYTTQLGMTLLRTVDGRNSNTRWPISAMEKIPSMLNWN